MDSSSSLLNDGFLFYMIILLFLAEFATGVVQLIGAIIRTIIRLSAGKPLGHLKTYWIMVGIYFFVLFIFYCLYQYLPDLDNYGWSDSDFENYARWGISLAIAAGLWIVAAWGIAIWYNIKIVFNRKPKTMEIENV